MDSPVYGTDPVLLVRAGAVDTSVSAAESVNTTHLERMVHVAIHEYGDAGCIGDQLVVKFDRFPYSSITARFRALLDRGLIIDTLERRPGRSGRKQRVMRSVVAPGGDLPVLNEMGEGDGSKATTA